MDDRQSPTLEDLANLLDAPESPGELGETKFFALWLLRQIPEIKKLWERMHEDPGDRPTMMELAQLYFSALSEGEYPESEGTARWLLSHAPATAGVMDELEHLRQDIGPIDHGFLSWAATVQRHEEFDRLLEALRSGTDWSDPKEILGKCEDPGGLNLQALHNIAIARIARAEGEERLALQALKSRIAELD